MSQRRSIGGHRFQGELAPGDMANANGNPPDVAASGGVVLASLALIWLPTATIVISFAGEACCSFAACMQRMTP